MERVKSGHELAARGRAHGGDVKVREADAFSMEAIHVGRLEDRIAVTGEVPVALIIGEDDQDIGLERGGVSSGRGEDGEQT